MENPEGAQAFEEVADLLELQGPTVATKAQGAGTRAFLRRAFQRSTCRR
jgi:hypothetical protein